MENSLRLFREMHGYTQKEIGERLGVSMSGYQKLEKGINEITSEKLKVLSSMYGVGADLLLAEPGEILAMNSERAFTVIAAAHGLSGEEIRFFKRYAELPGNKRKELRNTIMYLLE